QLQSNNITEAEREFAGALRRAPAFYPAETAVGDVWLARRDYSRAVAAFDRVLARAPMYGPALVGRGQALLTLNRETDALQMFEAALSGDPSLTDLRSRVEVLRFRTVQQVIETARAAAKAGRPDEARAAYQRALAVSPESGFLYRELGIVERRQGDAAAAIEHFRRAFALDPSDVAALVQLAELLEERRDFAGAEASYRKANEIEPSAELTARLADVAAKGRDARLPVEFGAIGGVARITRGDLAALIGVRLEDLVRTTLGREEVMTDVAGHWAAPWIPSVTRAGFIDAFENHTFQPRAELRRVDLARAVSRVAARMAATRPALRARLAQRPVVADVGPGHLNYPDVAAAVASGVMPLLDGNRFQVTRPVSGAEAIETIDRLRALANAPL
ncbi:MAG: tetratricopeptide repeat protein, partial [Vicinamibacterales bacterium]